MRAIFKRDFGLYFLTAIGYTFLGAYILVLNLHFYVNNSLGSTASLSGNFSFMLTVMMFIMPILTMRVFSEEFKQKTDQLLFTTPVHIHSVVMGKFCSALAVFGALLVMTTPWLMVISYFGAVNQAEVLGNYLGIICLGSAYIAMGIFISSLTENQVVAAIGTVCLFVAFYILEVLATVFYSSGVLPVFVMRSLSFLSIHGRYNNITLGLLSLDTIVFFVSLVFVFLYLTSRILERRKSGAAIVKGQTIKQKSISTLTTVVVICAVILVNILASILSERFFLKADLTEAGHFTISQEARAYLDGMTEPVDIVVLSEESAWLANKNSDMMLNILRSYAAASGGLINIQFVNPDLNSFDDPRYDDSLSVLSEAHTELRDMTRNDIIFISARRATRIAPTDAFVASTDASGRAGGRTGLTDLNADQNLISALRYVLNENIDRAVFVENHDENSSEIMQQVFSRSGYVCQTLNLAFDEIPADAAVVVSTGAKFDFLGTEIEKLERYLESGGNVIILSSFDVQSLPLLDTFLSEWGILKEDKLIYDEAYTFIPQLGVIGAYVVSGDLASSEMAQNYTVMTMPLGVYLPQPLKSAWADNMRAGFSLYPLVSTFSNTSYAKDLSEGGVTTYERESTDESGPFVLSYHVSKLITAADGRQMGANLIAAGADMFADDFLYAYGESFYNIMFIANWASDFSSSEPGVYIPPKSLFSAPMMVSAAGARTVLILLVIALPLAIVLAGVLVLGRRRHL